MLFDDLFKDDMQTWPGSKPSTTIPTVDNSTAAEESACTKNWTVANTVAEGTLQVFQQTGGFISACRHARHLLKCAIAGNCMYYYCILLEHLDLIFLCRAKYGLATLNEILNIFSPNQGTGYDIGCSHKITVNASSLGDKAHNLSLQLVIDAFHGHVYNCLCQLTNHPLFQKGFGLKDFATCEQIFAGTNPAMCLIQHASYFHWLQFLDLHIDQWDKDKYLELSTLLSTHLLHPSANRRRLGNHPNLHFSVPLSHPAHSPDVRQPKKTRKPLPTSIFSCLCHIRHICLMFANRRRLGNHPNLHFSVPLSTVHDWGQVYQSDDVGTFSCPGV
jgi:hypothetical protein